MRGDQLSRQHRILVEFPRSIAIVDMDVALLLPAKPFELLLKYDEAHFYFRVVGCLRREHADALHAGSLRTRRERPRRSGATHQRYEIASSHGPLPTEDFAPFAILAV